MKCKFEEFEPAREDGWRRMRCSRCGLVINHTPHQPEQIHATCGKRGLGDFVAAGLNAVGITKARVEAVRQALGLQSGCGCEERQEILNEIGKTVGL